MYQIYVTCTCIFWMSKKWKCLIQLDEMICQTPHTGGSQAAQRGLYDLTWEWDVSWSFKTWMWHFSSVDTWMLDNVGYIQIDSDHVRPWRNLMLVVVLLTTSSPTGPKVDRAMGQIRQVLGKLKRPICFQFWSNIQIHSFPQWICIYIYTYHAIPYHTIPCHTDILTYKHTVLQKYRYTGIQTYMHTFIHMHLSGGRWPSSQENNPRAFTSCSCCPVLQGDCGESGAAGRRVESGDGKRAGSLWAPPKQAEGGPGMVRGCCWTPWACAWGFMGVVNSATAMVPTDHLSQDCEKAVEQAMTCQVKMNQYAFDLKHLKLICKIQHGLRHGLGNYGRSSLVKITLQNSSLGFQTRTFDRGNFRGAFLLIASSTKFS